MKLLSIRTILCRALFAGVLLGSAVAWAEPGELDFTFGTLGRTFTMLSTSDYADDIAVQADGKIVLAGYTRVGSDFDILVLRFNADGSPDTGFGTDGVVITAVGASQDLATGVAVQPDGKIVVVGTSAVIGFQTSLVRYNNDGSLDSTFGVGGKVLAASSTPISPTAMALQPDGKIVIGGSAASPGNNDFAAARYLSNGTLDPTFGTGGVVVTGVGVGEDFVLDLALQADGKVVLAGEVEVSGQVQMGTVRLNSDGTLDASFGTGGKVLTSISPGGDDFRTVAVQPDGKIVGAGFARTGPTGALAQFAVVRYEANGALDPTFSGDGISTMAVGVAGASVWDVAVQSDGKILAAGDALSSPGRINFALVRYNTDGSVDETFGIDGIVLKPVSSDEENVRGMRFQADGKILVTGPSTDGVALARYFGGNRPAPLDPPVVDTKSGVTGEPSGTMFFNFGVPAIDAGVPGGAGRIGGAGTASKQVIYGGSGGVLVRTGDDDRAGAELVTLGDPVFGGEALGFAGVARLEASQSPFETAERVFAIRPGGKLAALYSQLTRAAGFKRLAAQAGVAPGAGTAQFAQFSGFGLPRDRGGLVFAAKLHRADGVTKTNDFGVWREKLTGGESELLLRNGDEINPIGSSARTVKTLSLMTTVSNATDQRRSFAPDGTVAAMATFANDTSGIVRVAADGSTDVPVDTAALVPDAAGVPINGIVFQKFDAPAIGDGGRLAFLAALRGAASGRPTDSAVFASTDGTLRRLFGRGDAVPGGESDRFSQVGSPLVGQRGFVAFVAALTGRSTARKAVVLVDGRVRVIAARLGESVAGAGAGVVYRRFGSVVVTDSDPARLVFTATIGGRGVNATNNFGLWSVSAASGTNLILRKGQSVVVGGQTLTVRSFEALQAPKKNAGQGRSTDASGFVTAKAKLSDGRSGVLRIPLP